MKRRSENTITLKIQYQVQIQDEEIILKYIKNYNNVLRYTYNRLSENPELSTADLTKLQNSMNNVFIDSHFKNSAQFDTKSLIKRTNVIFGGKKLFIDRCQNKISKEAFQVKKLCPIYSVGEAAQKSNRKFKIIDCETIQLQPDRTTHIKLNLVNLSLKYRQYLTHLLELQELKQIPITYKLDTRYLYMTFDYGVLKSFQYNVKQNRVMAIDMNPNYIGYSVVDWKDSETYNIVNSGVISIKELNDYEKSLRVASDSKEKRYVTNKRNFETIEIAKQLFNLCKHYHCETFAIEDLDIEGKDNGNHKLNQLNNNQWNRNLLEHQIKKRILASSTKYVPVQPQYSSFIGNILYREEQLPDMILSSIEIGRRGYEFANQYIYKRSPKKKNVIFPDFDRCKVSIIKSLEEFGCIENCKSWIELYSWAKKSKLRYRFSLEAALKAHPDRVFSINYTKRYIKLYTFQ